jgi:hypothetical protein
MPKKRHYLVRLPRRAALPWERQSPDWRRFSSSVIPTGATVATLFRIHLKKIFAPSVPLRSVFFSVLK